MDTVAAAKGRRSFLLFLSALPLSLWGALSCSVSFGAKEAVVHVSIGGAVPRTANDSALRGESRSRLILQETARIRLSADVEGRTIESIADYAGAGTQATLRGLPVGVPLTIRAETIDSGNVVLTSWTGTANLVPGANRMSATLRPEASSVSAVSGDLMNLAAASLPRGTARFFSIAFSGADAPNGVNEFQIIANTASFRSCWLEAYDADWNPIAPIAREASSGWTVVGVPRGGGTVNVAISAPSGDRSATLQARRAMFFASPADGGNDASPGTSGAPRYVFQNFLAAGNRCAFFIKAGRYPGSVDWSGLIDCRVYGGFAVSDWALRDPGANATLLTSSTDTGIQVTGAGCLDGMTIRTRDYPGMGMPGERAVNITSTQPFVIRNCSILGPVVGGNFVSIPAKALSIEGGFPYIVGCRIDGGNGTGGAGNAGVYVSGAMTRPFIYDCAINGGYCSGSGASNTWGVYLESGSAVIDACTIYGGDAIIASGGTAAASTGVYLPASPGSRPIIMNSTVSGGYALTASSVRPGIANGIYSSSSDSVNYPLVANCAIDSGIGLPDIGFRTLASIYSADNLGTMSANGNVLLVSSTYSGSAMVRLGSASLSALAYLARFAGNVAFVAPGGGNAFQIGASTSTSPFYSSMSIPNSGDVGANANYAGNLTYRSSPTTAMVFAAYGMGRLSGATTDFDYWLADNQWRPAAGMSSYFSGAYNPASSGDIPASDLAAYPELTLDRAGRPRPAAAPWARGAYEP